MLRSLQIRNYVLIDSLDVVFPEGLVIITGQTGAGKSILLGALSLLLGAKADQSVIGEDGGNCVVEADFGIPDSDSILRGMLSDNDIEPCSDLTIRRLISRSGRSRSFINDSPVPSQALQAIGSRLIDIHSQRQTSLLTDHSFQMSALDRFAGNESLLSECEKSFLVLKSLGKEISDVSVKLSRLSEEKEYNEARFKRLDDAHLQEGELEDLEAEQKRLANAEEIKMNLCSIEELLSPSDPNSDKEPVSSILKEAADLLERVAKFVPQATDLFQRIDSSRTEIDDITAEVSSLNSKSEISQDRLDSVESRMALLYDLLKLYSASSVADLISQRDALSEALFDSSSLEDRKIELEKQSAQEKKKLEGICRSLNESRSKAAGPFSEAVNKLLASLELERSVFKVEVKDAPLSASGTDSVGFLFSAAGGVPVDVAKCASGGELSRLTLALKAMMARFVNMPTLVFDEIDTGVSGSAADKMGKMICGMGRDMQVFAITHLPQVAAKGNAHYLVEKEYDALGSRAFTTIRSVEGEDRVKEIARMLSGSRISAAAIENARSLLSSN